MASGLVQVGPLENKKTPVGDEGRTLAASNAAKGPLTAQDLRNMRRRELFGFPSQIVESCSSVKVGTGRKIEKKTIVVVEMFEKLRSEFLHFREISKEVTRVTKCGFEFPTNQAHQKTCTLHIVGETLEKQLIAEDMMMDHIARFNEEANKRYEAEKRRKECEQEGLCRICRKPANHPWQMCYKVVCHYCNQKGHIASDCLKRKRDAGGEKYCGNCSQWGHTLAECKLRVGEAYVEPSPGDENQKPGRAYAEAASKIVDEEKVDELKQLKKRRYR